MSILGPRFDQSSRFLWAIGLLLGSGALVWTAYLGLVFKNDASRCAAPLLPVGARCCAPGQTLSLGMCSGKPAVCPEHMNYASEGCLAPSVAVKVTGGEVDLGPTDWDVSDFTPRHRIETRSFYLDKFEVTTARYAACVRAKRCDSIPLAEEKGIPVTSITPESAAEFCAAVGGHLPTAAEWIYAAMGPSAHRYPWGDHGLLCRRASYGLVEGPCAQGGALPELSGSRPEGRTKLGVFDLSGNVAELARDGAAFVVLGGSFRSIGAPDLKSFSKRTFERAADDVGFRCAYDEEAAKVLPGPLVVEFQR